MMVVEGPQELSPRRTVEQYGPLFTLLIIVSVESASLSNKWFLNNSKTYGLWDDMQTNSRIKKETIYTYIT